MLSKNSLCFNTYQCGVVFNVSKKSSGSSVGLVLQKLPKLWLAEIPRETCCGSQGFGSLQNKRVISSRLAVIYETYLCISWLDSSKFQSGIADCVISAQVA
jgi:hypothetical protein